ncbi:MAG: hypothetical protein HQK54_12195, partial [Oligoflexales bacterium]|nr:hypothetical protein [Oligoflexales bacterium]
MDDRRLEYFKQMSIKLCDEDAINAYLEIVKEIFDAWYDDAHRIVMEYVHPKDLGNGISTRTSKAFVRCHLKRIELSINNLKHIMKTSSEMFWDMHREFKEKALYLRQPDYNTYPTLRHQEFIVVAGKIGSTATSYQRIF